MTLRGKLSQDDEAKASGYVVLMKRFVTVLISVGLLAGVFGCSGDSISPEEKAEQEALDWLADYSYSEFQDFWDSNGITSVSIKDVIRKCVYDSNRIVDETFVQQYRPDDYPAYEDSDYTDLRSIGTDKWLRTYYQYSKQGLVAYGVISHDYPELTPYWWNGLDWSRTNERFRERSAERRICLADLLTADEFARFDFEGSALEPTLDLLLEQRRRALS